MEAKRVPGRIEAEQAAHKIGFLKEQMERSYLQLDLLKEGELSELCFRDEESGKSISLSKSSEGENRAEGMDISLNSDGLDCMKRLIAQCFLNPYYAEWLHYDIEMRTPQGKETTLCVCLI